MKKLRLLAFAFVAFLFAGIMSVSAYDVSDETSLREALEAKETNIVLTKDINILAPIDLLYDVTITSAEGNTYTIDGTNMQRDPISQNGSILTAHANLTLTNVKLANANKYGVQAYANGNVVLENVTIENSGFGAVLINGGTVTIKSLTMNNNSYGIEFGVGDQVATEPALIMDGTIDAENQVTPIHIDQEEVTELNVKNTEDSTDKISIQDNVVVIKDANNNVVAQSVALKDGITVTVDGQEVVTKAPEVEEPEVEIPEVTEPVVNTTTQAPEENPNTADNVSLYFILALMGLGVVGVTTRSLIKHH